MKHIRKIMIFIALVISMTCVYNFGTELNKYVEADHDNKAVVEVASADEFNGRIDFEKLREINPDVVGWINQNGTSINYSNCYGWCHKRKSISFKRNTC